jgi:hypothetical protein
MHLLLSILNSCSKKGFGIFTILQTAKMGATVFIMWASEARAGIILFGKEGEA